jgi:EAL domain-containing protein (putative c-di-GMP-specific phosphodiesterase class I)
VINRHNLGEYYDRILYSKVIEILEIIDDDISLSFNLSPFSLRKENFHDMMLEKIAKSGVDARRVIIELYEKKTHHRLESYLSVLGNLKRRGFRFCLDNFGSGNSSMEYIKHFRFDMVQFDREYISAIDDEKYLSIFSSLVSMAKDLDIVTVAKWVDDDRKREKLRRMGIDYIQGFSVGKVLDERELVERYNPIYGEKV